MASWIHGMGAKVSGHFSIRQEMITKCQRINQMKFIESIIIMYYESDPFATKDFHSELKIAYV